MVIYSILTSGKISQQASIGLGVKILDFRNVIIGSNSNVNFGSILDGRGGTLKIGNNVDIAPQVNIWTIEHNPCSKLHENRSGNVRIDDYVWLANRVIVLPNTFIETGVVIGAGSIVKGHYKKNGVYVSKKTEWIKERHEEPCFSLPPIRRFR